MAIRLWPQDYERKDHITKAEKALLRNAARNFKSGHIAVGIDPLGMSTASVKMGMYISSTEGLLTYSLYEGKLDPAKIDAYLMYVKMVEDQIYARLLDSKMLIVRNGDYKVLKFPYKHIVMFPDEKLGMASGSKAQLQRLYSYATYGFFQPITSEGKEKLVKDLQMFGDIRKSYDKSFSEISDLECRAIFERLAPEYTVVMNETENVRIESKKVAISDEDLRITGREQEYKTFFLDEYQVAVVNDMGKGHRVILANPGAGKSVLLLSKAFKYASMYKDSNVLLTCFNNNLADSYNFKKSCANFGKNHHLYIMTLHKLVKKIYEECLHTRCATNIATDEEIQACIELVRSGKVKLRFKAIFIDEVQIFDPLYLQLCYLLLEPGEDSVFLMAGDLNQAVRSLSRKGDAPWKRIPDVKLDFTGRVRYIEKNYRNSKEIGEYIRNMLTLMNNRLSMLDMINSMEYEYNSFKVGDNPTVALKVKTAVNRMDIQKEVIAAVKEIAIKYKIGYSDIAVLFPYKQHKIIKYFFMYWLTKALDEEGIPYSLITSSDDDPFAKKKYSETSGVVVSTIDSSLGLDFKAVIFTGLYPYNYVFGEKSKKEIKSWSAIKKMDEDDQSKVQSQMRSMYTACSRARDVLYVISDLTPGSPMEEIINCAGMKVAPSSVPTPVHRGPKTTDGQNTPKTILRTASSNRSDSLPAVTDKVIITAKVKETGATTKIQVDLKKYPLQKGIIGKKVGESFSFGPNSKTYTILSIAKG